MANISAVTLNNGIIMPQLGLGVYQVKDGDEVEAAVLAALQSGYRLIDTASLYGNEIGVGRAIKASGIPRQEIFVTTKLWNDDQGYDAALAAFDVSLKKLDMDYVDLYLIHWPSPKRGLYVETWRAFEEIYRQGRAKAIGVSNFHQPHLDTLLESATITPAVNQIELHPDLPQLELRAYCQKLGIIVESWSPLGGGGGSLLDQPVLATIGQRYGKSPAQVVIRWHIQNGLVVIPKSSHAERIQQNIDVFDFELSAADVELINGLAADNRVGPNPETATF